MPVSDVVAAHPAGQQSAANAAVAAIHDIRFFVIINSPSDSKFRPDILRQFIGHANAAKRRPETAFGRL